MRQFTNLADEYETKYPISMPLYLHGLGWINCEIMKNKWRIEIYQSGPHHRSERADYSDTK